MLFVENLTAGYIVSRTVLHWKVNSQCMCTGALMFPHHTCVINVKTAFKCQTYFILHSYSHLIELTVRKTHFSQIYWYILSFTLSSLLLQRGTALLLEHLAGSLASTVSVTTHLDIAPQHHLFMKGRNGSNIKHITQRTGAQIHFPDPNSPQKKSTVYIQGTIESVCLARQYLMVCVLFVFCLLTSAGWKELL